MVVTYSYNAGTNTCSITGAGAASFAGVVAADAAGGWGKYAADATGTQIICAAKIIVGDGTNVLTWADSNKQILFPSGVATAHNDILIDIKNNVTLTWGLLKDLNTKTTQEGITITCTDTTYADLRIPNIQTGAIVYFYSCNFQAISNNRFVILGMQTTDRLWNCELSRVNPQTFSGNVYNTNIFGSAFGIIYPSATAIIENINIGNIKLATASAGLYWSGDIYGTAKNVILRYSNYAVRTNSLHGNCYLINCDFDNWNFYRTGTDYAGTGVFRQYEFDLTTDANAVVTLKNNAGTTVFTETPATGVITTQTVSRGYYTQATGDTLQDYAPHTLTITKTGKQTYTDTLTLTEKTKLDITLLDTIIPQQGSGRAVIENPETKELLDLSLLLNANLLIQKQKLKNELKKQK